MKFTPLSICLLVICLGQHANAQVSVRNGDFEFGPANWNLFVPKESVDAKCSFRVEKTVAHSGKAAARFASKQYARFGINYQNLAIPVKEGSRYRLTVWVKAGANYSTAPGTPGPVIRATLFDKQMKDVSGGHIFVGLKGVQRADPSPLSGVAVPSEWTKIEGEIVIPTGADKMMLFVFAWKSSGVLWIDDFSAVEIASN